MTGVFLADASALQGMFELFAPPNIHRLVDRLTKAVDDRELGFPREVVTNLQVVARDDPVSFWAGGLGRRLNHFRADIVHDRTLMKHVDALGFEEGFETLDGSDPCIASIGRLACQYQHERTEFTVVTEDVGEGPLSPTMEQLCTTALWPYCDASACIRYLGLGNYLP
ncbi:hypothetical protein AB0J47_17945 [Nocardia sp. NPDC049737]|uniref:hypothetical protein n=1 Tax=Nocardia sp. NPDC049737 TaxID=3154358 RepID=UPI003421A086